MSFGGETYVDGGVREFLPLRVTTDLGADTVYAISTSPPDVEVATRDYANTRITDIVSRSIVEIMVNEISLDDARGLTPMADAAPPLVFMIYPDISIHDITTIDPGLIQINRGYGYMRAADVIAGIDQGSRRWTLSSDITRLRREIWALENRRFGQLDPTQTFASAPIADPSLEPSIRQGKRQLEALINERRSVNDPMPISIDRRSRTLERHL
ncbi:MAG: hypothetical protein ACRERE_17005 [Candidatus Entotheonellia bacterium]